MATVRESINRPLCDRNNHSLSHVVYENRDIQSIGAGRSVARMARLPPLCIPSSSAAIGNFAQDSTVQSQSITCRTLMASQALVSHAFESFGGQAMATSASEGSVVTDGRCCLASGPSSSATLGLAAGSNTLLIDCEHAVVHTIASARAVSTCQLYAARSYVSSTSV